jgi:hypothetical protein
VFANKQDLPRALKHDALVEKLDLKKMTGREWFLKTCVGSEGEVILIIYYCVYIMYVCNICNIYILKFSLIFLYLLFNPYILYSCCLLLCTGII